MQPRLGRYRGKWCIVWRDETGTRRSSTGLDAVPEKRQEAEIELQQHLADLRRAGSRPTGVITTDRCLSGYFETHPDVYPRPSLLSFFNNTLPAHIDAALCKAYSAMRQAAGKAPATIRTELGILRSALRWAAREWKMDAAPEVWRPTGSPPRDRWLTPDEAIALIDAAKAPHVRLFIQVALYTGARSGAILDLTWNRVSFDLKRIDFNKPGVVTANKKRAIVPIQDELVEILKEAKRGALSDSVIEFGGGPVESVKNGFAKACKRAKLVGVTPHTLRHTAATWAAQSGVAMWEIAGMLGHASSETTERVYAKHAPDYLKNASGAIGAKLMRSSPQVQLNLRAGGKGGTSPKSAHKKRQKS